MQDLSDMYGRTNNHYDINIDGQALKAQDLVFVFGKSAWEKKTFTFEKSLEVAVIVINT